MNTARNGKVHVYRLSIHNAKVEWSKEWFSFVISVQLDLLRASCLTLEIREFWWKCRGKLKGWQLAGNEHRTLLAWAASALRQPPTLTILYMYRWYWMACGTPGSHSEGVTEFWRHVLNSWEFTVPSYWHHYIMHSIPTSPSLWRSLSPHSHSYITSLPFTWLPKREWW